MKDALFNLWKYTIHIVDSQSVAYFLYDRKDKAIYIKWSSSYMKEIFA